MKHLLILFANGFPYNDAEPFLKQEVPLYGTYFDKVLVISGRRKTDHGTFSDPLFEFLPDSTLTGNPAAVLSAIPATLADPMFYRELKHLIFSEGFTFQKLRELLALALCANRRAALAGRWLSRHREYVPQAVYSYWMHIPAYAAIRLKQRRSLSCPTITRAHGYDLYAGRTKTGYQPFHRQIVSQIDRIATVSDHGKAYLEQTYGEIGKIEVHRLGAADCHVWNPSAERLPLRIVSCSRVVPVKRVFRIVDALCQLNDRPIHWTHLGGGEGLEALVRYAAKLPAHVTADFPGHTENAQVYQHYIDTPCHVFLNVSQSEGIPVSIMEAMSFGIPVIATAVGGTPELVEHGRSGFLLPETFSDSELTACLQRLLSLSDTDYLAMRRAAREIYVRNYRIPDNYHRFLSQLSDRARL